MLIFEVELLSELLVKEVSSYELSADELSAEGVVWTSWSLSAGWSGGGTNP